MGLSHHKVGPLVQEAYEAHSKQNEHTRKAQFHLQQASAALTSAVNAGTETSTNLMHVLNASGDEPHPVLKLFADLQGKPVAESRKVIKDVIGHVTQGGKDALCLYAAEILANGAPLQRTDDDDENETPFDPDDVGKLIKLLQPYLPKAGAKIITGGLRDLFLTRG